MPETANLTQIAVHPDPKGGLHVFAWCVTCNARKAGSAGFAAGSTNLADIVAAATEHLASDQHAGICPDPANCKLPAWLDADEHAAAHAKTGA